MEDKEKHLNVLKNRSFEIPKEGGETQVNRDLLHQVSIVMNISYEAAKEIEATISCPLHRAFDYYLEHTKLPGSGIQQLLKVYEYKDIRDSIALFSIYFGH